jgi:hypothetical protein
MAPLPSMSVAVVGVPYDPKRGFEVRLCRPGDPVQLQPEPKNKHDGNAVAVYSERGAQLGYLPAERAPWISKLIRQGREVRAIFQAQTPFGAWVRVAFDGEQPTLPPDRTVPPIEPEGGWFPDEVWEERFE